MASKENARDISRRCTSQNSKIRELFSEKHMYVHEGLEQRKIQARIGAKVGRVQCLVDWNLEGQHHLSSPWLGALVPAELKGTLLPDSVQEELRLSFITELLCDCPFSVPASLGFLTIMDHWVCPRANTVVKVRSQSGLGQDGFSRQGIHACVSFSRDPLSYLLKQDSHVWGSESLALTRSVCSN